MFNWFKKKKEEPSKKPIPACVVTLKLDAEMIICNVEWKSNASEAELANIAKFLYLSCTGKLSGSIYSVIERICKQTNDPRVLKLIDLLDSTGSTELHSPIVDQQRVFNVEDE